MLSITAGSQTSVFAQITPAPEKFDSTDNSFPDSSSSTNGGNNNGNNNESSGSSSGSGDDEVSHGRLSSDGQQDEATEKESAHTLDSNSDDNSHAITPSEKTDDATEESTDSTDSNGVNSGQTTTEQDDETINTEEQDPDPTNQLVEAIMNEVNEALSASSIFGP